MVVLLMSLNVHFIIQWNDRNIVCMCNTRFLISYFYRYTLCEKNVNDANLH